MILSISRQSCELAKYQTANWRSYDQRFGFSRRFQIETSCFTQIWEFKNQGSTIKNELTLCDISDSMQYHDYGFKKMKRSVSGPVQWIIRESVRFAFERSKARSPSFQLSIQGSSLTSSPGYCYIGHFCGFDSSR